jgi:Ca-activated chloride channel family protein
MRMTMPRRSLLFLLSASRAIPQGRDDYVLRTNANLVVLDVAVEDGRGRAVEGLTKEHFAIFEDGRRQTVKQFSAVEAPVSMGLVLDMSRSMTPRVESLRHAARDLMKANNSLDEYFIAGFNDRVVFALPVPFSSDSGQIASALDSLRPEGMTSLYAGVLAALDHIGNSHYERRVLVLISDGKDTASRVPLSEVTGSVRSHPVTIYTIGLFEDGDPDQNSGVLKQLAQISGGRYFRPQSGEEVAKACVRIALDVRSRYTLAYTPADTAGGVVRRIRVALERPGRGGLRVRARTEISMKNEGKGDR